MRLNVVLDKCKHDLDQLVGRKLAIECAVMDPQVFEMTREFCDLQCVYLLRCACGNVFDGDWGRVARGDVPKYVFVNVFNGSDFIAKFPAASDTFSQMPEWMVENIVEFYLFVLK